MPTETGFDSDIDQFDRRILDSLAEDGRMSITELARRVGLSNTPCQLRLKRLLAEGYIEGFKAVLSPAKLTNTHEDALRAFNEAVKKIPEVEECHMIAGRFDYLLKIRTSDIRRYRHVLGERISELPFVASTYTNVTMETVVDNWSARSRHT